MVEENGRKDVCPAGCIEEGGTRQESFPFEEFLPAGKVDDDVTWNHPNELAFQRPQSSWRTTLPGGADTEHGSREVGIAFVGGDGCLGMIIDVAHLGNDAGIRINPHTKKPFVASHSNARAGFAPSTELNRRDDPPLSSGAVDKSTITAGFLRDVLAGGEDVSRLPTWWPT